MSSWGATDADESKPKFLTDAEKKLVFANTSGWVLEAGSAFSGNDNPNATPEVLVAIGDLTTSLGAADITDVEFVLTSFSNCLLYTSPSPRDSCASRMPSSA